MTRHKVVCLLNAEIDTTPLEEGLAGLEHDLEVHIPSSPGETIEAVKGAEVVISVGASLSVEVIEEMDSVTAIVNMGHGFDHLDIGAATEKEIMVANTAGFVTEEVANHAMMLILACARKLTLLNDRLRTLGWEAATGGDLGSFPPVDGQVLGLVGFGNIARCTCLRAKPFGLEVIAYDPYIPPWTAKEYRVELVPTLTDLASRSDFVSMHTPLNDETRKLLGESFFEAMKPTAYFINTCRGKTVDEGALVRALQAGEIAGAGLDVFEEEPTPLDNPLLKMDNVVVTPHYAGYSDQAVVSGMRIAGQEAARILKGKWPMSLVNPDVKARVPERLAPSNP